jgi:hypothetical protein
MPRPVCAARGWPVCTRMDAGLVGVDGGADLETCPGAAGWGAPSLGRVQCRSLTTHVLRETHDRPAEGRGSGERAWVIASACLLCCDDSEA